jgi:predicted translin family RNA/ssDNA-binding protein
MMKKQYLNKLKKSLHTYASHRRDVIKISGDALHLSKRAIFAMHRENMDEADAKLQDAEKLLKSIATKFKSTPELLDEGSYKAGMEEYVEAALFRQFLEDGKIGEEIKKLSIPRDVFLAGLCDVPGELYRYAIKSATDQDLDAVVECNNMAQEIIETLTEFEFTKYLRNKFDQAKQAAHKLEYVVYEVSLRS